jgi:phenylpyruvate tautomerase PptA (4-oxalocrotonate tautomerase family)
MARAAEFEETKRKLAAKLTEVCDILITLTK